MDDEVNRVDERESGFCRAARGDFGPRLQHEYGRFVLKHPLSYASVLMMRKMIPLVQGDVAKTQVPLPDDKRKWWYDLEDVDGTLEIPAKSKDVEYVKTEGLEGSQK